MNTTKTKLTKHTATRTVTICIPPREEDEDTPFGKAHYFRAVVEGRTVVSSVPVEKPATKPGPKAYRRDDA